MFLMLAEMSADFSGLSLASGLNWAGVKQIAEAEVDHVQPHLLVGADDPIVHQTRVIAQVSLRVEVVAEDVSGVYLEDRRPGAALAEGVDVARPARDPAERMDRAAANFEIAADADRKEHHYCVPVVFVQPVPERPRRGGLLRQASRSCWDFGVGAAFA